MNQRSKSTLFLIEQLIVVAVFAICAAACISIMVAAYFNANESRSISNALVRAESAAEVFKATSGDVDSIADILGSDVSWVMSIDSEHTTITVHYDSQWQTINIWELIDFRSIYFSPDDISAGQAATSYILTIVIDTPQQVTSDFSLTTGQVYVARTGEDEPLVSLALAARN